MQFRFTLSPRLPKLAWLLELEQTSGIARVYHGEWVETREDCFVEGGWAGDFSRMRFDEEFMTGTGAKLHDGKLLLVAPNHTLDRLCCLRKGSVIYASNSLPCVLAGSGENVDVDFLFYDSYFASIRHGIQKYERTLPVTHNYHVVLYYCCNIVVNEGGELTEVAKRASPAFRDYSSYREYLDATARSIALNAVDATRKMKYTPMGTISRGYDSPAAAIIARSAGCKRVVTFRESRRTAGGEDCGTEIAEILGLSVKEFGRLDYRGSNSFPEIYNSGGPSEFLSFGDYLRGTLLFTGFNGDMVWNKNADTVSRDFVRSDSSGASLTEYRLDAGFVHLPVPFIAADRHPWLHAISNSREMAQWAIGTTYDRPIARRIVEEASIGRNMFGQKKRAAGVVVTSEGLAQTMSEASLRDYSRYLCGRWTVSRALKISCLRTIKRAVTFNEFLRRIAARLLRTVGLRRFRVPIVIPHSLRMLTFGYLGKESFLFHWGATKLVERYGAALALSKGGEQVASMETAVHLSD